MSLLTDADSYKVPNNCESFGTAVSRSWLNEDRKTAKKKKKIEKQQHKITTTTIRKK